MRNLITLSVTCVLMVTAGALCAPTAAAQDGYDELGRPMLGVVMTPPSHRDLRSNDMDSRTGVVIRRVYEGSAAEDMGLRRGDVITEINGVTIDSMTTLRRVVQSYQPGDEVIIGGLRGGQPLVGDGFLGDWPEHIPFRNIDAASEARYRRMVEERMARRAEQLEGLRSEQEALQQEINDLRQQQLHSAAAPANSPNSPALRTAADLMTAAWAADGLTLRGLPNWQFRYGMAVKGMDKVVAQDQAEASSATIHHEQNPEKGQRWSFAVSDRML